MGLPFAFSALYASSQTGDMAAKKQNAYQAGR